MNRLIRKVVRNTLVRQVVILSCVVLVCGFWVMSVRYERDKAKAESPFRPGDIVVLRVGGKKTQVLSVWPRLCVVDPDDPSDYFYVQDFQIDALK